MIECTNFNSFTTGFLLGFADFFIEKWGLEIKDCSVYTKEGRRWINFPAKRFETADGKKAYNPYLRFREGADMTMAKFTEEALRAIDSWCSDRSAGESQPQAAHPEPTRHNPLNSELPF